jgi:hypothetical protein
MGARVKGFGGHARPWMQPSFICGDILILLLKNAIAQHPLLVVSKNRPGDRS